jgi:hypothetical protein
MNSRLLPSNKRISLVRRSDRSAYFVRRGCRQASIADVAKELALDWHTVKALEMQYTEAQLARVGRPGSQVIDVIAHPILGGCAIDSPNLN